MIRRLFASVLRYPAPGLALLALALPATSAWAQPDRVSQATTGAEPLALVRVGAEVGLMSPAGTIEPLELPARTHLDSVEPLADGWLAAGSGALEDGIDLYLVRQSSGDRREIAPPPGFRGVPRLAPRPVVRDGRLLGLVWLEGRVQSESTVWAARWAGSAWGAPELVSPVAAGAQLAPSVTVLADASWLLVWSAVDGHDDEIVWSRRGAGQAGKWSPPAPVHPGNEVPDITPAVTAVEGGAVAVWSFLDRLDFRLISARFDGSEWTLGEPFGHKGSHRARFFAREGRPALLYRTSVPAGWMVVDHDAAGHEVRRAFVPRSHAGQPMLDLRAPEAVRLVLPAPGEPVPTTEIRGAWEPRP